MWWWVQRGGVMCQGFWTRSDGPGSLALESVLFNRVLLSSFLETHISI